MPKGRVRCMLVVGDLIWCAVGHTIYIYEPFNFTCQESVTTTTGADVESMARFETVVLVGTTDGTVECFSSVGLQHIVTFSLPGARASVATLAAVSGNLLSGNRVVPVFFAASATTANSITMWSTPN